MNDTLISRIHEAWGRLDPPFRIISCDEGDESILLDKEFSHRPTFEYLTAEFLDQTPDGFSSGLSFFADEAFRYYIGAYMIADLTEGLEKADPVFSLTHGLDDTSYSEKINPLRFGEQEWYDLCRSNFSMFDSSQVSCIISYLENNQNEDDFSEASINQALKRYWKPRLKELNAEQCG